jgi:two-component system NtrC family sensor kinase
MNSDLENIKANIEQSDNLSEAEKEDLLKLIKAVDKELTIVQFKLERTEKVKRTTSVLLEETIDELERKRADVEQANAALKKSLEELKATQQQLIHSEKMASLGELTAGIAHEIQNPLNFVNNFSDVSADLIEEMNEEIALNNHDEVKEIAHDLKSNLEKIRHHGQRASGIVKGMLEHSRTGDGEKESTDINALADEYLRLAYHGLRAKDKSFNADFKTYIDPNLPKVNVVPQDIGRVLLNLINNAFYAVSSKASATEDRGFKPEVIVSTKLSPSGGGKGEDNLEISVKDNGPGITEEIKEKIFQPFFTTKPTGSGTGLGLSLSYDIVKAHGGELKLESEVEKGTAFIIKLPIV